MEFSSSSIHNFSLILFYPGKIWFECGPNATESRSLLLLLKKYCWFPSRGMELVKFSYLPKPWISLVPWPFFGFFWSSSSLSASLASVSRGKKMKAKWKEDLIELTRHIELFLKRTNHTVSVPRPLFHGPECVRVEEEEEEEGGNQRSGPRHPMCGTLGTLEEAPW